MILSVKRKFAGCTLNRRIFPVIYLHSYIIGVASFQSVFREHIIKFIERRVCLRVRFINSSDPNSLRDTERIRTVGRRECVDQ